MYICTANFSNTVIRGRQGNPLYAAGVNLSGADLRNADLSNLVLVDTLVIQGEPYQLTADLTGAIYNDFTVWPPNYTPPATAINEPLFPQKESP